MGTLIKLAQRGIVGVNSFFAEHVDTDTFNQVPTELAINYVYIFTGNISRSINLPFYDPSSEDNTVEIGSVIKLKNLMDVTNLMDPDNPKTEQLIILANGNKTDGTDNDIIIETPNAIVEFIYINPTIGWALV